MAGCCFKSVTVMKETFDIIAGPCSAESEKQLYDTASGLNGIGIRTMRVGLWKPRSRYGSFEGLGELALPWLKNIRHDFGMEVMTEVALPSHIEVALKYGIDKLWIGARTTVNPFMITELAEALRGVEIPVFIKNPVCPDVELWKGAVERIMKYGLSDVRLIHRGFCLQDNTPYRNTPLWNICSEVHKEFGHIPLYCDPSHISGRRDLIEGICVDALKYDIQGFFIESHCNPDAALSDSGQQLTPLQLKDLLDKLLDSI